MRSFVAGFAVLVVAAAGCASEVDPEAGAAPEPTYPEGCAGLEGSEAAKCGEATYWRALQREKSARASTHDLLARLASATTGPESGRLNFLRGTLGMALALEDGRGELVETVLPDLRRAWELERNPKYPSWVDSMEIVLAYARNDTTEFGRAATRSVDNVELYPVGNILSISGTLSGFPLSTGLPQKAIELLERWKCDTDWCAKNTTRAPFSQPGIAYHFADAYARVGDAGKARFYLERSLAAEGAAAWPYRSLAEKGLADLDGFVGKYTALGDDKPALALVYANSREGCVLCHGKAP